MTCVVHRLPGHAGASRKAARGSASTTRREHRYKPSSPPRTTRQRDVVEDVEPSSSAEAPTALVRALRRNGSSRRRPGADPGDGGDGGGGGVRRPRGESCVAIRWVTAWGTTRGSRTVAPGWDIARFGEIGFAPWSRGEGRWARASSRRASRQASRQPRPARSKTGLGSEDESTIGSSWSSALAGEARASRCVRRAGFPACASQGKSSRGLHLELQDNATGDALRRCVPRRGRGRRRDPWRRTSRRTCCW